MTAIVRSWRFLFLTKPVDFIHPGFFLSFFALIGFAGGFDARFGIDCPGVAGLGRFGFTFLFGHRFVFEFVLNSYYEKFWILDLGFWIDPLFVFPKILKSEFQNLKYRYLLMSLNGSKTSNIS